jgi:outer membrane murein-binding lipoprotein Lpp
MCLHIVCRVACLQLAQLNQATADARLLGDMLQQLAQRQGQLQAQLDAAKQEAAWAEEASKKRVGSGIPKSD